MGLFNRLGREVEEFVQTAKEAADETETDRCDACETAFDSRHEECPECGEPAVTPVSADE